MNTINKMKNLSLFFIALTFNFTGFSQEIDFENPYLLKADGKMINTGGITYAAPLLGDYDGDAYEKVLKAKELTKEEKIQYEKLMKDYIETDKTMRPILKKRRKILNEASSGGVRVVMPKELELDKKVSEKNKAASNEIRKMHSQMSKIEKFGRVWVYIRK